MMTVVFLKSKQISHAFLIKITFHFIISSSINRFFVSFIYTLSLYKKNFFHRLIFNFIYSLKSFFHLIEFTIFSMWHYGWRREKRTEKYYFQKARFIIYLKISSSGGNNVELYQKRFFFMGGAGKSEEQLPRKKSIFIFKIETKKTSLFSHSPLFS